MDSRRTQPLGLLHTISRNDKNEIKVNVLQDHKEKEVIGGGGGGRQGTTKAANNQSLVGGYNNSSIVSNGPSSSSGAVSGAVGSGSSSAKAPPTSNNDGTLDRDEEILHYIMPGWIEWNTASRKHLCSDLAEDQQELVHSQVKDALERIILGRKEKLKSMRKALTKKGAFTEDQNIDRLIAIFRMDMDKSINLNKIYKMKAESVLDEAKRKKEADMRNKFLEDQSSANNEFVIPEIVDLNAVENDPEASKKDKDHSDLEKALNRIAAKLAPRTNVRKGQLVELSGFQAKLLEKKAIHEKEVRGRVPKERPSREDKGGSETEGVAGSKKVTKDKERRDKTSKREGKEGDKKAEKESNHEKSKARIDRARKNSIALVEDVFKLWCDDDGSETTMSRDVSPNASPRSIGRSIYPTGSNHASPANSYRGISPEVPEGSSPPASSLETVPPVATDGNAGVGGVNCNSNNGANLKVAPKLKNLREEMKSSIRKMAQKVAQNLSKLSFDSVPQDMDTSRTPSQSIDTSDFTSNGDNGGDEREDDTNISAGEGPYRGRSDSSNSNSKSQPNNNNVKDLATSESESAAIKKDSERNLKHQTAPGLEKQTGFKINEKEVTYVPPTLQIPHRQGNLKEWIMEKISELEKKQMESKLHHQPKHNNAPISPSRRYGGKSALAVDMSPASSSAKQEYIITKTGGVAQIDSSKDSFSSNTEPIVREDENSSGNNNGESPRKKRARYLDQGHLSNLFSSPNSTSIFDDYPINEQVYEAIQNERNKPLAEVNKHWEGYEMFSWANFDMYLPTPLDAPFEYVNLLYSQVPTNELVLDLAFKPVKELDSRSKDALTVEEQQRKIQDLFDQVAPDLSAFADTPMKYSPETALEMSASVKKAYETQYSKSEITEILEEKESLQSIMSKLQFSGASNKALLDMLCRRTEAEQKMIVDYTAPDNDFQAKFVDAIPIKFSVRQMERLRAIWKNMKTPKLQQLTFTLKYTTAPKNAVAAEYLNAWESFSELNLMRQQVVSGARAIFLPDNGGSCHLSSEAMATEIQKVLTILVELTNRCVKEIKELRNKYGECMFYGDTLCLVTIRSDCKWIRQFCHDG